LLYVTLNNCVYITTIKQVYNSVVIIIIAIISNYFGFNRQWRRRLCDEYNSAANKRCRFSKCSAELRYKLRAHN